MFTRILEREYNKRSLLKPLLLEKSFKLPLEKVYTRLSIVSRRKTDFHLESNEVNVYDIFKTLSKGEDAMVLVEVSPGIGKTTFCLKISHDWANKKIPNESSFPIFELLLLLKCRDVHGDIMEAIIDQLLPDDMDEKAKEKIIDYIKDIHHQERILIILDGLDELPKTAESHVDKLLDRRILPFCYVLATSRQEKGITVRQEIEFDVLLQIKGFTEEDSFEYIRKHFNHLGPDHVQKGERLILAIQENTFLHALPSNPLNLLLLCVIFEDYHGDLPSFRTELYQIIICCLLRRYCAKHDLEAPADNKELEEKFEDSLLVLGELAWRCLLEDRFSFREEELARFERAIKNLAARKLGLVFKEASATKINPQHEYHFFHKTFQEYLAALYLAHKLLKKELTLNYFDLNFYDDIIERYQQVFIFVSGILGGNACVLFEQIGKKLEREDWDWLELSEEEATFFIECLSESRNAEQVATTLLSFIPFPPSVTIDVLDRISPKSVLTVVNACKDFSQLRLPVHLTIVNMDYEDDIVADFLRSYPRIQTLFYSACSLTQKATALLCDALRVNPTLYSFTLKTVRPISSNGAVPIGDSLAANKTLKTVTFKLLGVVGEDWATALETGLSADTPLTSVVLEIFGPMSDTEIGALKKVLLNKSLTSLVLTIYEDMQDSLATTAGEELAADSSLKSLSLTVYGNISCSGATILKYGFLGNSSLNSLELKVFGELPNNWVNICEAVYSGKKSSMSFTVYPNFIGKIKSAQVALCPVLEEKLLNVKLHSLTLNIWGELNCSETNDFCKLLIASEVSCVSLNINGRVTNSTANYLLNYFNQCNTLSALSINIWGELTRDGNSALQALSCNQTYSFTLTVNDLNTDEKICKEVINVSSDESLSLTSVFTKVHDTCSSNLNLMISSCSNSSEELRRSLVDGLTKNTSLTTLSLTLNHYSNVSENSTLGVGEGLAKNTSLTTLSLTINNHSDTIGGWPTLGLKEGLAKNTSLTTLIITLNNYSDMSGDWIRVLEEGLAKNKSLTTLSFTINNYSHVIGGWILVLKHGLAKNTSLTTLSITINNYNDVSGGRILGLEDGLAKNTSLTTLSITIDNYNDVRGVWILGLEDGLAKNTSLTTLSITLNNYNDVSGDRIVGLEDGLAKNTSLTTLSLTLNNCSAMMGGWILGLAEGLAKNTSLATLNLRLKNCSNLYEDWGHRLRDALAVNTLLTTISLEVDVFSERNGNSESGRV